MVWWFEIKGDWKDVITKHDAWLDDLGLEKTPNPAILGTAEKNLNMEWTDDIMKFLWIFLSVIMWLYKRISLF